jgi:hypothetical protein
MSQVLALASCQPQGRTGPAPADTWRRPPPLQAAEGVGSGGEEEAEEEEGEAEAEADTVASDCGRHDWEGLFIDRSRGWGVMSVRQNQREGCRGVSRLLGSLVVVGYIRAFQLLCNLDQYMGQRHLESKAVRTCDHSFGISFFAPLLCSLARSRPRNGLSFVVVVHATHVSGSLFYVYIYTHPIIRWLPKFQKGDGRAHGPRHGAQAKGGPTHPPAFPCCGAAALPR